MRSVPSIVEVISSKFLAGWSAVASRPSINSVVAVVVVTRRPIDVVVPCPQTDELWMSEYISICVLLLSAVIM